MDKRAEITLEPDGIYVKEYNEMKLLDAIGDGHKSLVRITLDILVWYLLKINYSDNKGESRSWKALPIDKNGIPNIKGIVIIDEVEQHLHPKLQRQILKRLDDKFPKIQFIITTHSPLCVSGTADVCKLGKKDKYKIYSARVDDEGKVDIEKNGIPHGLRADQVLVDYFELSTTLSVSLEEDYKKLHSLFLAEKQNGKEFKYLKNKIKKSAPVLGESIEEREMMTRLERMTSQLMTEANLDDKE